MERFFAFLLFAILFIVPAFAAPTGRASRYIDSQSYAYMYPYLNNKMRTELNPGTTVSQSNNPIDVIVKTTPMSEPRRVVARTAKTATTNARAATTQIDSNIARRVVQRPINNQYTGQNSTAIRSTTRNDSNASNRSTQNTTNTIYSAQDSVSSARCMADYTNCMNMYCLHEDSKYNRCYCSSKLSQIDAEYQPQIENMIIQILTLRGNGQWSDEEMNEYWMERIGNYAGENSWIKLDEALSIDWPTPDDRVRGAAAFMTGHEYCVQHLRACSYMAQNLRDAYRSLIARDCSAYENSLMLIRNAARSVIEHYSD
jgi:hypothetical protein